MDENQEGQEIKVVTVPELGKMQREFRRKDQEGKLPVLKLMIATPYYMQQEFARYGDSMLETVRMLEMSGVAWQKQSLNGDSYIDRAKNTIIANFLESDCTDLLMIDSDMSFSPEAVARMLRHTQGVVGGFFPMKNNFGTFCGSLEPDKNGCIPDVESAIEIWDGSCLLKAHLIPGGFLRLKRDVLERFADYYSDNVYQDPMADMSKPTRVYTSFMECMVHEYTRYGEDATFCRRMREMGETIYCDPNITFGHTGMKTYVGNYHQSLLKPPEELEKLYKERQELADSIKEFKVEVPAESDPS